MDVLIGNFFILACLGLTATIGFLIFLIVTFVKKKENLKKTAVIGTAISFVVFLATSIIVVVLAINVPDETDTANYKPRTSADKDKQTTSQKSENKDLFSDISKDSVQYKGFKAFQKSVLAGQTLLAEGDDKDNLAKCFDLLLDISKNVVGDQLDSQADLSKDLGGTAGESIDEDRKENKEKYDEILDEMKKDHDEALTTINGGDDDELTDDQKVMLNNLLSDMTEDFTKLLNVDDKREAYNQLWYQD